MATLHALCGLPGSGKSTWAAELARQHNAVVLANDEWMRALFGRNPPAATYQETFARLETLQWQLAAEWLRRGVDVVWDYGLWRRADRAELRRRAAEIGAHVVLHEVTCDFETAVARVLARSAQDDGHLMIDRAALETFRARFEPPEAAEGLELRRLDGTAPEPPREDASGRVAAETGGSITYRDVRHLPLEPLLALYRANGWSSAGQGERLRRALLGSHALITAWDGATLVGLGNAISDGALVVYYPHLLVLPAHQGRGIGREIVRRLRERYADFHMQMLVADGDAVDFYAKCGFERAGRTEPMWIYAGGDH